MSKKEKTATSNVETETGQFGLQKIYVKNVVFETSCSPEIFDERSKPTVDMNLHSTAKSMENNLYEVILSVTVTTTIKEKTAYRVNAHQAGIFHIDGFHTQTVNRMVATVCPNILFPFAREHIADLTTRGGFPQILLAPVNFEMLYQQNTAISTAPMATKH